MASANINFPMLDINSDYPGTFNFSPGAPSMVPNMGSGAALLDLTPGATQELSIDVYDNVLPSNTNENRQQYKPGSAVQALSKLYGVNENMLQWSNENFARVQINSMMAPDDQLTVNVDPSEGGMHSWRPNLTDSLTSDVFVAQPGLDNGFQTKREQPQPQLFLWDSPIGEEPVSSETDERHKNSTSEGSTNYPRIDVQSHLQTQRTQLNCLKYEVINAKRKMHEIQAAVAKLSCELEEKLLFKNSKEMKTLRNENAELRLECQCLCSEVDFYLSGEAPLGETDEAFWAKLAESYKPENANLLQLEAERQVKNLEEQEEANKWECPLCTFANHPAISSCEMCHVERNRKASSQLHSSDICYCHPQQDPHCS